jgi:hypothetical protein
MSPHHLDPQGSTFAQSIPPSWSGPWRKKFCYPMEKMNWNWKGWWWKCRHFLRILLVIHYILILTIHFLFRSSFFSTAFLSSSSSDMKKIFDSFIFFIYSYSYLYCFFYFSAVFTFSLYRLCSSFPHLLISHSLRIRKLVFYLVRLHFFSYFFTSKETRKYKGYKIKLGGLTKSSKENPFYCFSFQLQSYLCCIY